MASVPTYIQLPTTVPTQDPALAGFLAQLGIQLNQWILQAATAINANQTSITVGDWTITEQSDGGLLLTFTKAPGGSWTIPKPNGSTFTVKSA